VHVSDPGVEVTTYEVIVEPPSFSGAAHETSEDVVV
jgi:hypothetical protein